MNGLEVMIAGIVFPADYQFPIFPDIVHQVDQGMDIAKDLSIRIGHRLPRNCQEENTQGK